MNKCKYCGSENLYLENKSNKSIMELPQVALKCANCGKWLKWCPKEERQQYLKINNNRYQYSWNEADCIERIIDTKENKSYEGCESAIALLNKQDKQIKDLEEDVKFNKEIRTFKFYLGDYRVQDTLVSNDIYNFIKKQAINELIDKLWDMIRNRGIFGQNSKDMNYLQFKDVLDQFKCEGYNEINLN